MNRRQSILTVPGFQKSYVPINEAVEKLRISDKNIIHVAEDGTEQTVYEALNSKSDGSSTSDNPISYAYAFDEQLNVGDVLPQDVDVSIVDTEVYQFLDTNSGKVYTVAYSDEAEDFVVTKVEDADLNAVYYFAPQRTYYRIVPVVGISSTTYQCAVIATAVAKVEPQISAGLSVSVVMDPSKYNVIGKIDSLTITAPDEGDTIPYDIGLVPVIGRFTANSNSVNISLPSDVSVCSSNPDIEADHTYEYNIFDGVFNLIDVTVE